MRRRLLFVLLLIIIGGFCVVDGFFCATDEDRWRQRAYEIRVGMPLEEAIASLGEGWQHKDNYYPSAGQVQVDYFYSWQRGGQHLQVGVTDGTIQHVLSSSQALSWSRGL